MTARPPGAPIRVYLDNASTSWPKPAGVGRAMAEAVAGCAGTPGRGGHVGALASSRLLERVRAGLAGLIGSPDPRRIILTGGATEALNGAIFGLLGDRRARGPARVVTTVFEHNSVSRPLAHLERRGEAEVVRVGGEMDSAGAPTGMVAADAVLAAVDERTELVAVTHASNVTGVLQPVAAIARGLRARGSSALFLVDAAQTAGVVGIDVEEWGVDLLAWSGHKALLGPTGTGALYVGPRAIPDGEKGSEQGRLRPWRFGGTGGVGGSSEEAEAPPGLPQFLEAGTPNLVGFAGLLGALEREGPSRGGMNEGGARRPQASGLDHERRLVRRIIERLSGRPRVRLIAPEAHLGGLGVGVLSFVVEGYRAEEVAGILDESFGIAVRAGLHCAPGAHRAMGTHPDGTVRVSPGPFSTEEDVDALCRAVSEIAAA